MTRDGFNSLVTQLEVAWRGRPEGLLKHTVGWVVLGYITLLLSVLVGLLLLGVGVFLSLQFQDIAGTLVAGAVAMTGLVIALFILGCLWVRFEVPAGLVLEEKDHPELHRMIREIGERAGGVRFHQVVLDPEMNASVVQNPRLGILGWYRTYLVIGLPLMEALPLDEFKAVLAHEIAHLSRADGKTGAWLHRTRTTWERVIARLSSGMFRPLLGGFFNWFWPRFNSRAFILSRYSELAADRFSAETVSADALASGLQRLAILGRRVENDFWEPLERGLDESADLPDDVMGRLSEFLRTRPDPDQARRWVQEELTQPTDTIESHPGLAIRLAHLERLPKVGGLPELEWPGGVSAAERLLLPAWIDRARRAFSQEWLDEARALTEARRRKNAGTDEDNVRKAWERIAALSRLDGLEKIQPEVLALLERRPGHSGALYLRGCHLAQKDDPDACRFLEQASSDPTLAGRVFETLASTYARNGKSRELAALKERAERHQQELRAALVERNQVCPGDFFLPHDLGEGDLENLRRALEAEPVVRRAWLAAKQVRHFPRWRHLILMLDLQPSHSRPLTERARRQLDSRLLDAWDTDAYVLIVAHDDSTRAVLRTMRRGIPDCETYRRK